MDENPMMLSW
ncbi:unnamed protein product [Staurois parvus]|uniref:Uncharacterized protein n=1 Tax=Staurois parvus TaxID=386267 RepID=A0ABN9C6P2_9NEOB|nr:unnamed protein product [Staurois parvus]